MNSDARELVERLIGPAGPEIGCDECFEALCSYTELVAAGKDADTVVPGMREHLVGCPVCRDDFESLLALISK